MQKSVIIDMLIASDQRRELYIYIYIYIYIYLRFNCFSLTDTVSKEIPTPLMCSRKVIRGGSNAIACQNSNEERKIVLMESHFFLAFFN